MWLPKPTAPQSDPSAELVQHCLARGKGLSSHTSPRATRCWEAQTCPLHLLTKQDSSCQVRTAAEGKVTGSVLLQAPLSQASCNLSPLRGFSLQRGASRQEACGPRGLGWTTPYGSVSQSPTPGGPAQCATRLGRTGPWTGVLKDTRSRFAEKGKEGQRIHSNHSHLGQQPLLDSPGHYSYRTLH